MPTELEARCCACAGTHVANCRGSSILKPCWSAGHDAGDVWKESEEWQAAWRQKQEAAEQRQQQQKQKQAAKQQERQEQQQKQVQQQQQQQQKPGDEAASTAAVAGKAQKKG